MTTREILDEVADIGRFVAEPPTGEHDHESLAKYRLDRIVRTWIRLTTLTFRLCDDETREQLASPDVGWRPSAAEIQRLWPNREDTPEWLRRPHGGPLPEDDFWDTRFKVEPWVTTPEA